MGPIDDDERREALRRWWTVNPLLAALQTAEVRTERGCDIQCFPSVTRAVRTTY